MKRDEPTCLVTNSYKPPEKRKLCLSKSFGRVDRVEEGVHLAIAHKSGGFVQQHWSTDIGCRGCWKGQITSFRIVLVAVQCGDKGGVQGGGNGAVISFEKPDGVRSSLGDGLTTDQDRAEGNERDERQKKLHCFAILIERLPFLC